MPFLLKILIANVGALLHLAAKVFEYATAKKEKQECDKKAGDDK